MASVMTGFSALSSVGRREPRAWSASGRCRTRPATGAGWSGSLPSASCSC